MGNNRTNGAIVLVIIIAPLVFIYIIKKEDATIKDLAADFFDTYNERRHFEKFLSFYSDDIILEDMINGDRIIGKVELRKFFNWDTPNFKPLDSLNRYIIIENLSITENQITAKGYFPPFQWFDSTYQAIQYTTLLFLNNEKKIIRQVDWINYPQGLVDYETRKNSNDWIKGF